MRHVPRNTILAMTFVSILAGPLAAETLRLQTRRHIAASEEGAKPAVEYRTVQWEGAKTAVIVCDMWAKHWCAGATDRVQQMAPRMNAFLGEARNRGALIIHAPSGGVKFYEDHPARRRAKEAPQAASLPDGIGRWRRELAVEKGATWPVDQADGGCDCSSPCEQTSDTMDRRQIAVLEIAPEDAITDSGVECWNLLEQRGIEHVLMVGVHTNMCVLGRPFGIRNLVHAGKDVLLVRDLTDAMYNSRKAPFVPHVRGTELVVEYIERLICPTCTSSDLLGGPALRFREDDRPHVAILVSDDHYKADETLPVFAGELRERWGCYVTLLHGEGTADIRHIDELDKADVLVLFIRRLALPEGQMAKIRQFLNAGKPLVAMRTASHAFDIKKPGPEGTAQWPEFDADVLGGNYNNHGPNAAGSDIAPAEGAETHPILKGVEPARWHSTGSLYFTAPIRDDATLIQVGRIDDRTEPLTWTRSYGKARVFYTALGHPDDFDQPAFRRLLVNGIFWAMDRQPE